MNKKEKKETLEFVLGCVEIEYDLMRYDLALLELENARRIIKKELNKYNKDNG